MKATRFWLALDPHSGGKPTVPAVAVVLLYLLVLAVLIWTLVQYGLWLA